MSRLRLAFERAHVSVREALRTVARPVLALIGLALALAIGVPQVSAQGIPLIRDTEIETLLNDYASPIFKVAPNLGGGRVRIRIVRNDAFNAFVQDGNFIYMHTGALQQSETPNQVIGVIAHETGHISGSHVAAMQSRLARESTRILLLRALGIGVAIATGQGAAVSAGDELVIRSFLAERRSQEGAADLAGLEFLNATKQSARGMLETFERFAQQEYISDTYKDPFVRSHPIATDRLSQLRTRVQASPFYTMKDPPALQLRHDLMRAKLAGYLEPPSAVLNKFPISNTTLPARYARALAKFFRGGPGALESALADVEGLIRERPDYPYFHELKGDLLMRSGRMAEATVPLRQALKLSGNASLIQVQLAGALVASKDAALVGEAVDLLRKAQVRDPTPRGFRALGDAYYFQNKQAEADASIAQAHALEGNFKEAKIFAQRATRGLTANSPLWIRMDDIIRTKVEDNG